MKKMQHFRPASYRVMPWKNGLGKTTEIAVSPATSTLDNFAFRISIADVEASGPFSKFPGVDRVIMQLEGAPMRLLHEGKSPRTLSLLDPYVFSGELKTSVTLEDGPTKDFNVMVRRNLASAIVNSLAIENGQSAQTTGESETCIVYLLEGEVVVDVGGIQQALVAGETLQFDGSVRTTMTAQSPRAVVILTEIRKPMV